MSSRTRLGVLCVCCMSWVATSSTTIDTATLRSMGLSRKEIKEVVSGEFIEEEEAEIIEEVDDEEEPWKSNEDWWKDPLSMFSDDEEEEKEENIPKTVKEEEAPVVEEKIIEEKIVEEEIIDEPVAEEIIDEPVVEEIIDEPVAEEEIIDEPMVKEEIMEEPVVEEEIIEDPIVEEEIVEKPKEVVPVKVAEPEEVVAEMVTKIEKKAEAKIVERKSDSSSVASPLALLVPIMPKIQIALSSLPVVQLAASAVVAKFMVESVMTKLSSKKEGYLHDKDSSVSADALDDRLVSSDDDLDELEPVETPESTTEATRMTASRRSKPSWVQGVGGIFTRASDGRRIPPARDLLEQVESLRAHVTKVESERDIMEKEYEKASFQLQEAQTELATLTTTTRYLKAQLRDNEEAQDKAIRAERRKAKEELARMKEAMVGILNKERRAMRDELKRQTTELRSLLMEATGRDGEYAAEGR